MAAPMQQLFLKSPTHGSLTVQYPIDGCILDIKKAILETKGIPIEKQIISFCGREVQDDVKVSIFSGETGGMLIVKS